MKALPVELLGDFVVVKPDSTRQGKIFVPDWSRSLRGDILAVGPDVRGVIPGEKVTFRAVSGMESVYDGVAVRIMREDDLDSVLL